MKSIHLKAELHHNVTEKKNQIIQKSTQSEGDKGVDENQGVKKCDQKGDQTVDGQGQEVEGMAIKAVNEGLPKPQPHHDHGRGAFSQCIDDAKKEKAIDETKRTEMGPKGEFKGKDKEKKGLSVKVDLHLSQPLSYGPNEIDSLKRIKTLKKKHKGKEGQKNKLFERKKGRKPQHGRKVQPRGCKKVVKAKVFDTLPELFFSWPLSENKPLNHHSLLGGEVGQLDPRGPGWAHHHHI